MALLLSVGTVGMTNDPIPRQASMVKFLKEYLAIKYQKQSFNNFLYVAVKQQKMFYIEGDAVVAEYLISTAKNGIGNTTGSRKTPTGLHFVREKVGADVPLGGIIREKVYTGEVSPILSTPESLEGDFITTRLFHLDGAEPGVNKQGNCDSYSRGIMIHGTPEEGLIGQPVSHGCVRMKNKDIEQLYTRIRPGIAVIILNN